MNNQNQQIDSVSDNIMNSKPPLIDHIDARGPLSAVSDSASIKIDEETIQEIYLRSCDYEKELFK